MLSAEKIDKLLDLGLSAEMVIAIVRIVEEPNTRSAAAERQKRYRERKALKQSTNVTRDVTRDVTETVTQDVTRYVTDDRQERINNNPPIVPPNKAVKPKKAMIPADWEPSPEHIAAAAKEGLSLDAAHREARKFRDYHRSKGTMFVDWMAAWRNWIRKAVEINPNLKKGQNPDRHWLADTPGYGFG